MKSALAALVSYYETGDGTGYMQAVWRESQELLDVALSTGDPRFIGAIAGLVFLRREYAYDQPLLGRRN